MARTQPALMLEPDPVSGQPVKSCTSSSGGAFPVSPNGTPAALKFPLPSG